MKEEFEKLLELFPVVILGAFGGLVRTLSGKERGERYSWKIAIPEILIAMFCGLVTHWLLLDYHVSENIRTATIALSGYCARSVLDIIQAVFLSKIKSFTKGKK